MSPEHVPAPQLASPAGAAFGAPGFLEAALVVVAFAGAVAAPDAVVLPWTPEGATAVGSDAAGVVVEGVAPGGALGLAVGGGVSDFGAAALAEQPLAEHDACPPVADAGGETSFARTG